MYSVYFGLTENPFTLTPDPRFLFMSERHREALAHLLYGMGEKGGFVLLTGEVGTGKTTLCRSLLEQAPEDVEVALILNPKQSATELVASLCDELNITYPAGTESLKILVDLLNQHLLKVHSAGRRTVLIIDEAQNLSFDVLEQIRLLTNLETPTRKLLQILLIGQPELQSMMAEPELRQLGQRITARYHLTPLLLPETIAYIQHRLEVGGCKRHVFTKGALRRVHKLSKGVPRLVNTICDRALLGAYGKRQERINRRLVRKAAAEVIGRYSTRSRFRSPSLARVVGWSTALGILCLLAAGVYLHRAEDAWSIFPKQKPETGQGQAGGEIQTGTGLPGREKEAKRLPQGQKAAAEPVDSAPVEPKGPVFPVDPGPVPNGSAPESMDWLKLLLDGELSTGMNSAFAVLTRCWGIPYEDLPGKTPCDRVAAAGLSCLEGSGNWTTLRHLNRPALIELAAPDGRQHHVPVVALHDDTVTLVLKEQEVTLPRIRIDPFWYGDYTVLWKRPPLGSSLLKKGDRGRDVLWLRATLERVEGREPGRDGYVPSPLFDKALEERVTRFQRTHFVRADGMVGEQTLIQLNEAAGDPAIPLLHPAKSESLF
ncbi:MAG: AAA family ATPase [Thermodesulfobacteriota bacterium]